MQGHRIYTHERCGRPAREVKIDGMLTSATAVLCEYHRILAERENFVSKRGFTLKQVRKRPATIDESFLPFRKVQE